MLLTNGAYYADSETDTPIADKSIFVTSAGHHSMIKKSHFDTVRPNGRRDYQILYVKNGKIYYTIDNTQYICEKDHILLYRPYEPQFYTYYLDDSTDVYWAHFTGNDVDNILKDLHLSENRCQSVKSVTDFTQYFEHIISEFQIKSYNYTELANLNFKILLYSFSKELQKSIDMKNHSFKEVNDAITYFNANFNQNIDIIEYAKSQNMSIGWFIKLFRRQMNTTPHKYLIDLRIAKAKSLLTSTLPINEIAYTVGFTDPLYFSRAFHKSTGMSPSQYREHRAKIETMYEKDAPWEWN